MITEGQARDIVQKKFPDYVIEWCISYKNAFVVMAHPDDGPEDDVHGAYSDPFYVVDKRTGRVASFVPVAEKDRGAAFFAALHDQLG